MVYPESLARRERAEFLACLEFPDSREILACLVHLVSLEHLDSLDTLE